MTKAQRNRQKVQALFNELAAAFQAAPIVETNHEFRDVFDRAHSRVTVELTHGTWSTFAYEFAHGSDGRWRQHESREAAKSYARAWLGGAS